MLRLSRLADYAVVILCPLARGDCRVYTARTLSDRTGLPWPTVAKVLKILSRAGLVGSVQGRQGGYRLARAPGEISLAQVIEAVEGPVRLTECIRETGRCSHRARCPVQSHWETINDSVRSTLARISLRELAASPGPGPGPDMGPRAGNTGSRPEGLS